MFLLAVSLDVVFALDLGGAVIGALFCGIVAAIVFGVEPGGKALWRWARKGRSSGPTLRSGHEPPEDLPKSSPFSA